MPDLKYLDADKLLHRPLLSIREILVLRSCMAIVLSLKGVCSDSIVDIEDIDRRLSALCEKEFPGRTVVFCIETYESL